MKIAAQTNFAVRVPDTLRSTLLLAGSFTFAFLMGEMIHEWGHYLAHFAYGNSAVQINLDPFGNSRILGFQSAPLAEMGATSAAGPLTNLLLGLIVFILLRQKQHLWLLPLQIWGPVALIQEGVTFSLGLLTPGGDAAWIAAWGPPEPVVLAIGIILLTAGVMALVWLLQRVGLLANSLRKNILVVVAGMGSLMFLRSAYAFQNAPTLVLENLIPAIFSLLLALIVMLLVKPVHTRMPPPYGSIFYPVTWRVTAWAVFLGAGLFWLQLIF